MAHLDDLRTSGINASATDHREMTKRIHEILNTKVWSVNYTSLHDAAADAAEKNRELVISGAHSLNTTLALNCAVSCTPDARLTSSANPAVSIGTDNAVLSFRDIDLPPLQPASPTFDYTVPTIGEDVGVLLKAMRNCRVRLRKVEKFSTAVHVASSPGREFSYNTLYDCALNHNGVGLFIYPADGAWCNENRVDGGQINMLGGQTRVPGTRFIEMRVNPVGGHGPNGWAFYSVSLEGNTPEYHVYLNGAHSNHWYACRWEGNPFVHLTAPAGEFCLSNVFHYGYNLEAVTLEADAQAAGQVRDNIKVMVGD